MGYVFPNESIEVLVRFAPKGLGPLAFKWNGKRVNISAINLRYDSMAGRERVYHFAVSDNAQAYQLDYYSQSQQWKLGGYYVD